MTPSARWTRDDADVSVRFERVERVSRRCTTDTRRNCGIQWANIDGGYWRNFRRPADGIVDSPKGWDVDQRGTLIYIDASTVQFESSAGSAVFHRTNVPPRYCA